VRILIGTGAGISDDREVDISRSRCWSFCCRGFRGVVITAVSAVAGASVAGVSFFSCSPQPSMSMLSRLLVRLSPVPGSILISFFAPA